LEESGAIPNRRSTTSGFPQVFTEDFFAVDEVTNWNAGLLIDGQSRYIRRDNLLVVIDDCEGLAAAHHYRLGFLQLSFSITTRTVSFGALSPSAIIRRRISITRAASIISVILETA
jgi:hypothetical protein